MATPVTARAIAAAVCRLSRTRQHADLWIYADCKFENDGLEALGRCWVSAYSEAFEEGQEFVVEPVPCCFDFKRRRARQVSLINARLQTDHDTCRHREHSTGTHRLRRLSLLSAQHLVSRDRVAERRSQKYVGRKMRKSGHARKTDDGRESICEKWHPPMPAVPLGDGCCHRKSAGGVT